MELRPTSNGHGRYAEPGFDSSVDPRSNFPLRLFELMDKETPCSAVDWDESGEVILVHKPTEFLETILPKYFSRKDAGL